MSFISPEFVLFFCAFFPLYFGLPFRLRLPLLFVSGYFFYGYGNPQHLWIIALTTCVDYLAGRLISGTENPTRRRLFLAASMTINLGLLFWFKYSTFFIETLRAAASALSLPALPAPAVMALPVGISFYTFQSMAYTIDVYRRRVPVERNFLRYGSFVSYFPQLVAGPIERAQNLLPQFRQRFQFDETRVVSGLRQVLWGFFKKVVIADRLAIYVNAVYNDPQSYSGAPLIIATLFFAFQIYCDFSGYSDIAIGTARIMGFKLMDNFKQPYFAESVRAFWGRWHISLSTWFRDYVYIPLGGNRVRFSRNLANLFVVFLISGLWHGASWTFVLWGALHGIYVVIEAWCSHHGIRPFRRLPGMAATTAKIGLTFTAVCFAWILFRANSLTDASYILTHLFAFGAEGGLTDPFEAGLLPARYEFVLSCGLIALLLFVDWLDSRGRLPQIAQSSPAALRWAAYYGLGAAVILSGLYGAGAVQFIYFQF